MEFKRGLSPKQSLDIGVIKEMREEMEIAGFNSDLYWDAWDWALHSQMNRFFSFLASYHGKAWSGNRIARLDAYNNEILWKSIEWQNVNAVKAVLSVPDLFDGGGMTLEQGASKAIGDGQKRRRDGASRKLVTNLGTFVHLSRVHHQNAEIEALLLEYYHKNKPDERIS